ncbi:hypothetical protein O6H91_07G028800 [Diphasiastrum complanatum]|uniref:Uncharacterized protein n=1 Tax=Diphasiastrum complanatum TaxID=34168 RepID=A0ACC2D3U9_DIPCM|nr:hypothetical protein O6H91_07G028800 [Diphasiastrum complanatum]
MNNNSMEPVCCHAAAAASPCDAAVAPAGADAGAGDGDDSSGAAQELLQELDVKTRLRTALEMYEQTLEDLKNHGLLEQLQQLEGKEAAEFFDRLKERIESKSFLEKLCGHLDVSEREDIGKKSSSTGKDHSSWLLIDEDDTFKSEDDEGYVVVTQDDIVDGIACFMAKYMSVVPKAKELSPQELQKGVHGSIYELAV